MFFADNSTSWHNVNWIDNNSFHLLVYWKIYFNHLLPLGQLHSQKHLLYTLYSILLIQLKNKSKHLRLIFAGKNKLCFKKSDLYISIYFFVQNSLLAHGILLNWGKWLIYKLYVIFSNVKYKDFYERFFIYKVQNASVNI